MQFRSYACLVCFLNASCGDFLKFMQLHCHISFRYARCTMRGREARADGIEPQDGASGPIQKAEGLTGVHA